MHPNNIRSLLFSFLCALVLLGWSQPGSAGVVIISGDDADEDGHCYSDVAGTPDDGTLCGSLYPNAFNLAISSSTSPGSGIVAIGGANCGTAGKALRAWNDVANGGPGVSITVLASTTAITSVNLSDFKMLYIPSIAIHLGGFCGLEPFQLVELNKLAPQIQHFVNVLGGSVIALIEADSPPKPPVIDPWGWLPFPFVTTATSFRNVTTTVNMPLVSPTTNAGNLSHSAFHMVFETPLPSGFLSLADAADGPNIPPEHIGKPTYLIANIISPENCTNGIDDDQDGLIDKADPDCLICGDGILDAPLEQCDDGNLASGDGCDMFCKLETPPDDEGPDTTNTTADPNPVAMGSLVNLTANVDDTNTGGSDIASAEYRLDNGSWTLMGASDSAFDSVSEDVTADFSAPIDAGIYDLCVRGTDNLSNVGDHECIMLVVYDPNAGFVTGGGWIDSPAGAYIEDPGLTGKANFGFVSKYKKGATVPTGKTEFQFKAGGLNFHSSSYDFLVITMNSTNAQFKGFGTVNGGLAPNGMEYRFMIWAHDDSPDTFRIRIWYESGGEIVVYDNGTDQEIGGGSIVIHTKGKK